MERIKSQIHSKPIYYSSQNSLIALRDDIDVQLATVLLESLSGTQLPELEQIDKIIFKMRFAMASERHSEQEWKIINSLYSEILKNVDIRDLMQVTEDNLNGKHSEFMPKPTPLAKMCRAAERDRIDAVYKLKGSIKKYNANLAPPPKPKVNPQKAEQGRKLLKSVLQAFPSRRGK